MLTPELKSLCLSSDGRVRIWMHAVSAGEVVAAAPILRELRKRLPDSLILFSVITPVGRTMAEQSVAGLVQQIFYAPFDLPWIASGVVRLLRPDVYISMESELWPLLLDSLKRSGTTTVLVNGRISDPNFQRSSRWGKPLMHWMLGSMDRLLMQSALDADRIARLAGDAGASRVEVIGNSKFDQEIGSLSEDEQKALRESLELPADRPVFVAGSTRSSEEEAMLLDAYRLMTSRYPDLCLVMAPRKIDRAEELEGVMRNLGLNPVRRSAQKEHPAGSKVQHLILDTMGELANVYAVALFTYIGNSFPPVVNGGGQNLLQPLAHGKPVIFGPKTATIRSETALALETGVGFRIESSAELAEVGLRLLDNPELQQELSQRALKLVAANRGVSARYADAVVQLLQNRSNQAAARAESTGAAPTVR